MDGSKLLIARYKELAGRCNARGILTHGDFLSLEEMETFLSLLPVPQEEGIFMDVEYKLEGGHDDAERRMLFFMPDYMDEVDLAKYIACVKVEPKDERYSEKLTHRDYLGALMSLGFNRSQVGDILTDGTNGYLYIEKPTADIVLKDLNKVKHTDVRCSMFPLGGTPIEPKFGIKTAFINSPRLDVVLKEAFGLPRKEAQEAIEAGLVRLNGRTETDTSHSLDEGDRISMHGKGKFVYLGQKGTTKKERLAVELKIFG